MAIIAEALSGGLTGLAQSGPGATGRAAATGFQNSMQQRQQAQTQQQEQAQTDANNQASALARRATTFETNMRGMLNAAQVEQYGADVIDKVVQQNRVAGLLDPDQAYVENGGVPMLSRFVWPSHACTVRRPTPAARCMVANVARNL
jgi:hypothetical protein